MSHYKSQFTRHLLLSTTVYPNPVVSVESLVVKTPRGRDRQVDSARWTMHSRQRVRPNGLPSPFKTGFFRIASSSVWLIQTKIVVRIATPDPGPGLGRYVLCSAVAKTSATWVGHDCVGKYRVLV